MKLSRFLLLMFYAFAGCAGPSAYGQHAAWKSEHRTWIDDSTGYEITQWTSTSRNWHLYFNVESFIDDTHAFIMSDRTGKTNLFILDVTNGALTQATDEDSVRSSIWHLPALKRLWYINGGTLKELNTQTLRSRAVHEFGAVEPESFAVTCDGAFAVFSANKHPGFTSNHSTGPYALFRVDLTTKEVRQISPDFGFILSHVQTNPTDPRLVSYCWQHRYREGSSGVVGNAPVRIWWNTIDGTDGGPVGPQEFGLHRTHEAWTPDGKRMTYSARYVFGPRKGEQFLGSTTIDGKDNFMIPAPIAAAHSQMFADNKHWTVDLFNGPYLVLVKLNGRGIDTVSVLFRHDSSFEGQPTHPHPHFSPDGKYILFSTDRTGKPQVYTVRVDLGKERR